MREVKIPEGVIYTTYKHGQMPGEVRNYYRHSLQDAQVPLQANL